MIVFLFFIVMSFFWFYVYIIDIYLGFPGGASDKESESEVAWLYPTLRDPMDCSPPGSSIHRIFQVRVLEWVAISFSKILEILQVFFKWLRATQSNAIKFKEPQIVPVVISRCYNMFQPIIPFKEDIPICPRLEKCWKLH